MRLAGPATRTLHPVPRATLYPVLWEVWLNAPRRMKGWKHKPAKPGKKETEPSSG
jgi:hypothetical protein